MTAPWTPRERALYKALEKVNDALCVTSPSAIAKGVLDAFAVINAAIADPPPPDPRDAALRLAEEAIEECKTYITLYQTDSDGPQACEAPIIHNDYLKCEKALASIRAANGGA